MSNLYGSGAESFSTRNSKDNEGRYWGHGNYLNEGYVFGDVKKEDYEPPKYTGHDRSHSVFIGNSRRLDVGSENDQSENRKDIIQSAYDKEGYGQVDWDVDRNWAMADDWDESKGFSESEMNRAYAALDNPSSRQVMTSKGQSVKGGGRVAGTEKYSNEFDGKFYNQDPWWDEVARHSGTNAKIEDFSQVEEIVSYMEGVNSARDAQAKETAAPAPVAEKVEEPAVDTSVQAAPEYEASPGVQQALNKTHAWEEGLKDNDWGDTLFKGSDYKPDSNTNSGDFLNKYKLNLTAGLEKNPTADMTGI